MESGKIFIRNPNIVTREDNNEALLFNPEDGNLLCINETGAFIWNLCDGTNSEEDIIQKLLSEYEVTIDKAKEDLNNLISRLKEAGFLGYKV